MCSLDLERMAVGRHGLKPCAPGMGPTSVPASLRLPVTVLGFQGESHTFDSLRYMNEKEAIGLFSFMERMRGIMRMLCIRRPAPPLSVGLDPSLRNSPPDCFALRSGPFGFDSLRYMNEKEAIGLFQTVDKGPD